MTVGTARTEQRAYLLLAALVVGVFAVLAPVLLGLAWLGLIANVGLLLACLGTSHLFVAALFGGAALVEEVVVRA